MRNSTISDVNLKIRFIEIIARFGKRRNLILTNCDLICGRRDERVFSRLIEWQRRGEVVVAKHTNIMYVNGTTTGISSKQKKEVKDRRSLSKKI